jgi:hypothetical protein
VAKLIQLPTIQDNRGKLTVFQDLLPDGIKRVFYIYDHQEEARGGHRHKNTTHALVCPLLGLVKYTSMMVQMSKFSCLTLQKNA